MPTEPTVDAYGAWLVEVGMVPGAPYGSETLAAVYHPRVQQLLDLKAQGYTYAAWTWDATQGHNRWHGVPDHEVPEH